MFLERWRPGAQSASRWDPFVEMADLHRQMDQVIAELFGPTPLQDGCDRSNVESAGGRP